MIPYGSTASVTDNPASTVSTLDAANTPAAWVQIRNRSSSSNSFDVSYDGGSTYITRLDPGSAYSIGGKEVPISIAALTLVCSDVGGTATAEITCVNGRIH